MSKERKIRVTGQRRAFEVGRFVLAVMVYAEVLADAKKSGLDAELEAVSDSPVSTDHPRQKRTGTIWGRAAPPADEEERDQSTGTDREAA